MDPTRAGRRFRMGAGPSSVTASARVDLVSVGGGSKPLGHQACNCSGTARALGYTLLVAQDVQAPRGQVGYEMQVRETIEVTKAGLKLCPDLDACQDFAGATDCNGIPSRRVNGERTTPTGR